MLESVVEVLVFGLQRGAIFGLVGLGLALVYKATRVLNFAQGELGTVPAFVAFLESLLVTVRGKREVHVILDNYAACVESPAVLRHQPLGTGLEAIATRWLPEGPLVIGLTAGASTPNSEIGRVVERIASFRGVALA